MIKFWENRIVLFLGVVCTLYWVIDFINIVLIMGRPTWVLWYSSAGLLLTGIALITRNVKLVSTAFCALFVIEFFWSADFIYFLSTNASLFGFTSYLLDPNFSKKDFYMTLYHLLIPISLFTVVWKIPTVWKYGWVGATIYASTLLLLTYLFAGAEDRVNCVRPVVDCETIFSFMYLIPFPHRIFAALIAVIGFVYIPSNYLLLRLKKSL